MNRIKILKPLIKNEVFYDLGSGSGKVLIAASLSYPFCKCMLLFMQARASSTWSLSTAFRWSSKKEQKMLNSSWKTR